MADEENDDEPTRHLRMALYSSGDSIVLSVDADPVMFAVVLTEDQLEKVIAGGQEMLDRRRERKVSNYGQEME